MIDLNTFLTGFLLFVSACGITGMIISAYCLLELKAQKYSTHTIELRDMNTTYDDELDEVIKDHETSNSPDLQHYDKGDDASIEQLNKKIIEGMVI